VAPVCPLQGLVCKSSLVGLQDRQGTLPEQLRPAHAPSPCNTVEPLYQFVIELNQDLPTRHAHMVTHMPGDANKARRPP